MWVSTIKAGQAVQIGNGAVVKVLDVAGQRVRMGIALTSAVPIRIIADGIIPPAFEPDGIVPPRRVLEAVAP